MKGGLLINGRLVDVSGATILAPRELDWVYLDARDHRKRTTTWVRQVTTHTTGGKPVKVVAGKQPNPLARARAVALYWSKNPRGAAQSGGAHIIVAGNLIVCLVDLWLYEAFHATKVNPWSVGIEMCQDDDGTLYEDTLATTLELELVLADELGIPFQTPSTPYRKSKIIERLRFGGSDVVGFFGHRDNAWMFPEWFQYVYPDPVKRAAMLKTYPKGYADRSQGDPGDEIYALRRARGAMGFDFDKNEELAFWRPVQEALNAKGEQLTVNGMCDPGTVRALRKHGLWNGGIFLEAPII